MYIMIFLMSGTGHTYIDIVKPQFRLRKYKYPYTYILLCTVNTLYSS